MGIRLCGSSLKKLSGEASVASKNSIPLKVLVIEDDLNMRIYLCNLLRADGFDPLDATDKRIGLQIAKQMKPALIVLDGMLPEEESIDIYYHLKSDPDLQHIPVVMLATIDQRTFCYYRKCQRIQYPKKVPDPEAFMTTPPEAEDFLGVVRHLSGGGPPEPEAKGRP